MIVGILIGLWYISGVVASIMGMKKFLRKLWSPDNPPELGASDYATASFTGLIGPIAYVLYTRDI